MISHKQQQQLLLLLLLIIINKTEVRKAVPSFPVGSSGGPDGLRPRHLRDLIQCRESGGDFLSALTAFVKLIWCWLDAIHLKPCVFFFFGGRLLALKKNRRDPPHRRWFHRASPGFKVRQYLRCKSAIFIPQPDAAWCGGSCRMRSGHSFCPSLFGDATI